MSGEAAKELNTGIVIAGAYADKLRRTLYAQLAGIVKTNKEFAREVARASAELNMLLFHVLVEGVKVDKGDAVRIRVKYVIDEKAMRIKWLYDTLKLEVFKRVPDEQVESVKNKVINEKLAEIQEKYKEAPTREEVERILAGETEETMVEKPVKPVEDPLDRVMSLDLVGETLEGGYLFKITGREGASIGLISMAASGEDVVFDAVLLGDGEVAYRYIARTRGRPNQYVEAPDKILEELRKTKPTQLGRDEASRLIEEKMKSLL
mgnify:CR=1 FL=1